MLAEKNSIQTLSSLLIIMLFAVGTSVFLLFKISNDIEHNEQLSAERLNVDAYEALSVKQQLHKKNSLPLQP